MSQRDQAIRGSSERVKELLKEVIQDLENALNIIDGHQNLGARQAESHDLHHGPDLFAIDEDPAQNYTASDVVDTVNYIKKIYQKDLSLDVDSSILGAVLYLSLDPIVNRLYRVIKTKLLEGYESLTEEEINDDLAALEFVVFLRNQAHGKSQARAFVSAQTGDPRDPNKFDALGSEHVGTVDRTILPQLQGNSLRGLVIQKPKRN